MGSRKLCPQLGTDKQPRERLIVGVSTVALLATPRTTGTAECVSLSFVGVLGVCYQVDDRFQSGLQYRRGSKRTAVLLNLERTIPLTLKRDFAIVVIATVVIKHRTVKIGVKGEHRDGTDRVTLLAAKKELRSRGNCLRSTPTGGGTANINACFLNSDDESDSSTVTSPKRTGGRWTIGDSQENPWTSRETVHHIGRSEEVLKKFQELLPSLRELYSAWKNLQLNFDITSLKPSSFLNEGVVAFEATSSHKPPLHGEGTQLKLNYSNETSIGQGARSWRRTRKRLENEKEKREGGGGGVPKGERAEVREIARNCLEFSTGHVCPSERLQFYEVQPDTPIPPSTWHQTLLFNP
ncbi:hypothetical protein WN55_00422 [Dufourea novaeangliae]|uniref:Uncharacterized protein n=1 Tax=Dufourea novaeangliae TaxID=178035 RepID=A0A154PHK1_DUFNO|nr:hypothetical protein WN55_00422 [Dufourea novaeangliae]